VGIDTKEEIMGVDTHDAVAARACNVWEVARLPKQGGRGNEELHPCGIGEEADGSRRPRLGTLTLGQASGLAQGNKRGDRCGGTKGLRRGFPSCLAIVLDGPGSCALVGSL